MHSVFLGGTCNGSTWRDDLIQMLDPSVINAFNPVVEDWNEQAQAEEDYHKANDDYTLYVITPEMTGVYSIFEVAMDSCKRPGRVVCCILRERNGLVFEDHMMKNMTKIKKDLIQNGTPVFDSLEEVAAFFNNLELDQLKTVS